MNVYLKSKSPAVIDTHSNIRGKLLLKGEYHVHSTNRGVSEGCFVGGRDVLQLGRRNQDVLPLRQHNQYNLGVPRLASRSRRRGSRVLFPGLPSSRLKREAAWSLLLQHARATDWFLLLGFIQLVIKRLRVDRVKTRWIDIVVKKTFQKRSGHELQTGSRVARCDSSV